MRVEVIYTIEVPEEGEGTKNFLADADMDAGHGGEDYLVVGRRFGRIT